MNSEMAFFDQSASKFLITTFERKFEENFWIILINFTFLSVNLKV